MSYEKTVTSFSKALFVGLFLALPSIADARCFWCTECDTVGEAYEYGGFCVKDTACHKVRFWIGGWNWEPSPDVEIVNDAECKGLAAD